MAYNKTPFKMMGKSPMMKALVGKQGNLPMHLQEKIKAAPAKQVKQDSSGVKDVMTGERKKADRQVKQDSAGTKDVMTKQVKQDSAGTKDVMTKQVKQDSSGTKDVMTGSPVKQVKVKDLPEKAVEAGEKIIKGGKKLVKKIGNITLISKERQDCKKAGGKYSKKGGCFMPKSPAKKKGCSKKY